MLYLYWRRMYPPIVKHAPTPTTTFSVVLVRRTPTRVLPVLRLAHVPWRHAQWI